MQAVYHRHSAMLEPVTLGKHAMVPGRGYVKAHEGRRALTAAPCPQRLLHGWQ
jgi:hypothetical protein